MRVGGNPYLVTTCLFHTTRLLDSLEYIGLISDQTWSLGEISDPLVGSYPDSSLHVSLEKVQKQNNVVKNKKGSLMSFRPQKLVLKIKYSICNGSDINCLTKY